MVTAGSPKNWVQCTQCGKVYLINEYVPIDKLYIDAACPRCDNTRALNCGNKKEDIVLYYDPYLDERYYRY